MSRLRYPSSFAYCFASDHMKTVFYFDRYSTYLAISDAHYLLEYSKIVCLFNVVLFWAYRSMEFTHQISLSSLRTIIPDYTRLHIPLNPVRCLCLLHTSTVTVAHPHCRHRVMTTVIVYCMRSQAWDWWSKNICICCEDEYLS